MIDLCMEAGANFFDTADVYSGGESEKALGWRKGGALAHLKREDVLISTKATFRLGEGPNDTGSSRYHLMQVAGGEFEAAGDGLCGCVSHARVRCFDAGGGGAEYAG